MRHFIEPRSASILCQCTKCGAVFDYSERKKSVYNSIFRFVCPQCGGTYTLMRPSVKDKYFLDKHFFEVYRRKPNDFEKSPNEDEGYSDGNEQMI